MPLITSAAAATALRTKPKTCFMQHYRIVSSSIVYVCSECSALTYECCMVLLHTSKRHIVWSGLYRTVFTASRFNSSVGFIIWWTLITSWMNDFSASRADVADESSTCQPADAHTKHPIESTENPSRNSIMLIRRDGLSSRSVTSWCRCVTSSPLSRDRSCPGCVPSSEVPHNSIKRHPAQLYKSRTSGRLCSLQCIMEWIGNKTDHIKRIKTEIT